MHRHLILLVSFFGILTIAILQGFGNQKPEKIIKKTLLADLKRLDIFLNDSLLQKPVLEMDESKLQANFLQARRLYKKVEWAIEYFMPSTARFMNGPPLDELELEENMAFPPHGLQVLEGYIFPKFNANFEVEFKREVQILQGNCNKAKTYFSANNISDAQILDALKLQCFRVITLGISGFDCPIALSGINEAEASLASTASVIKQGENWFSKSKTELPELLQKILDAQSYCLKNTDFEAFNRFHFITHHINPITESLTRLILQNNLAVLGDLRPLKQTAHTIFDSNAFDVNAFTQSKEYWVSDAKIALGKAMFRNTSLSKNGKISCATCHEDGLAFTDGRIKSIGIHNNTLLRNAPSLNYAALQNAQFWDMRQGNLESQISIVVRNKEEMDGSLTAFAELINKSEYKNQFSAIFKTDSVSVWQIQNVIASYIRSLPSFSSRLDSALRGEAILNKMETNGFNLFMGKAKCGTCHFMPLFNGTVPPNFIISESEVLGVPIKGLSKTLDHDLGRFGNGKMDQLRNAFKTPSLRNVALTSPYMHNGGMATLEEVIEFYDIGGGLGLGLEVPNQTLPGDSLKLTTQDKKALITFLHILTDRKM